MEKKLSLFPLFLPRTPRRSLPKGCVWSNPTCVIPRNLTSKGLLFTVKSGCVYDSPTFFNLFYSNWWRRRRDKLSAPGSFGVRVALIRDLFPKFHNLKPVPLSKSLLPPPNLRLSFRSSHFAEYPLDPPAHVILDPLVQFQSHSAFDTSYQYASVYRSKVYNWSLKYSKPGRLPVRPALLIDAAVLVQIFRHFRLPSPKH